MPKRLKSIRGFTLLEVLVASLILSVALAGLSTALIIASRQSSVTSNKTMALFHVNETIRMLSTYVADEPDSSVAGGGFAAPETAWFSAAPDWQSYTSAGGPWGDSYALYDPPAAAGAQRHYRRGDHATAPLSLDFRSAPINGSVYYDVETNPTGFPAGWKKVSVTANWTEP